jgi:hypothetical protein
MSHPDYKALIVGVAAAVVRGLPAPTQISIHANGDVYLTLERCADVVSWSDSSTVYEYRYDPNEEHPHGYRIVGGHQAMLGTEVRVTAGEGLSPTTTGDDEEAVLAFVGELADDVPDCDEPDCGVNLGDIAVGEAKHLGAVCSGLPSSDRIGELELKAAVEQGPVCDGCEDCATFDVELARAEADVEARVPAHARESLTECVNCGELIWKGLVWVHVDGEDAQCRSTKESYAKPVDERLPLNEAWADAVSTTLYPGWSFPLDIMTEVPTQEQVDAWAREHFGLLDGETVPRLLSTSDGGA